MHRLVIQVPDRLFSQIDELASEYDATKSETVRELIRCHMEDHASELEEQRADKDDEGADAETDDDGDDEPNPEDDEGADAETDGDDDDD
jgi:predicted transcriptional regulator